MTPLLFQFYVFFKKKEKKTKSIYSCFDGVLFSESWFIMLDERYNL